MAKNRRNAAYVRRPRTAEEFLNLRNSLPPAERIRAFELVTRHPENVPARELLEVALEALRAFDQLWTSTRKLWGSDENAAAKRAQLEGEELYEVFKELKAKVAGLQPTRGLTPDSRETLKAYRALLKKHGNKRGAKAAAQRELVTLPSEQGKSYVNKYKEPIANDPLAIGDLESVRNYIKALEKRDQKRMSRE
jgi:hypothetical protein